MRDDAESSLTIRDLLRVLFRHRWLILAVMVLAIGGTFAALVFSPRIYESEAKLFVRMGRENLGLDPTAATSKQVTVYETRESEINSILEILKSRTFVDAVVDQLTPEAVLRNDMEAIGGGKPAPTPDEEWLPDWLAACRDWGAAAASATQQAADALLRPDVVSPRERAVTEVFDALEIWSPRKSAVILIRCRWKSPEMAQKIVSTFIEVYEERHLQLHRTLGSYDFFTEQESLLASQLAVAEGELRDLKNAGGLSSLEGQRRLLESEIALIETQALELEANVREHEGRIASLRAALQTTPDRLTLSETSGINNVALDSMRASLYGLEMQEKEMSSRFQDEHPQLKALRDQLAQSRAIIDRHSDSRTQTTAGINPTWQRFDQDLTVEGVALAAASAKRDALAGQRLRVLQQLRELNDRELAMDQLARKVSLLQTNYHTYAENLEQARIDQALASERITNVTVVQAPTFLAKPVSPKRMLIAISGLAIAFLGSFGLAFAWEYLDRSIKTQEEAERTLELPVLLSVPRAGQQPVMN